MTNAAETPVGDFTPHWRQRDGAWYVCVLADEATAGAEVEVLKKDGATQLVTLAEVGEAGRDWDGHLVCLCTVVPRTSTPKQRGLLHYLAKQLSEVDPGLAEAVASAADNELLPMSEAHELITGAKAVLGDDAG